MTAVEGRVVEWLSIILRGDMQNLKGVLLSLYVDSGLAIGLDLIAFSS